MLLSVDNFSDNYLLYCTGLAVNMAIWYSFYVCE